MPINKEKVKAAFSKSSCTYDQAAEVQQQMICLLMARLPELRGRILEIGTGTGLLASLIVEKYPKVEVVAIDLAPGMIELAQKNWPNEKIHYIVADGEDLPFADNEFDCVVSNASYQWMDIDKAFAAASRVLKPGGCFHFTTFGPETLIELKELGWPVNKFYSRSELEAVLGKYFKQIKLDTIVIKKAYANAYDLLATLKALGSQNQSGQKQTGLLTKKKVISLLPDNQGGISITYEVLGGVCSAVI